MADSKQARKNTTSSVYRELEDVEFPMKAAVGALGEDAGTLGEFMTKLAGSLKVPFGAVMLGMMSLSAFMSYRTVAQYTPMLGVPPLPWLQWLGNSGDGKSKLIWWLKQVIKECEKRATRRAIRKYKVDKKNKKEAKDAKEAEDDADDTDSVSDPNEQPEQ